MSGFAVINPLVPLIRTLCSSLKHLQNNPKSLHKTLNEQTCALNIDTARLFVYTWDNLGNKRSRLGNNWLIVCSNPIYLLFDRFIYVFIGCFCANSLCKPTIMFKKGSISWSRSLIDNAGFSTSSSLSQRSKSSHRPFVKLVKRSISLVHRLSITIWPS